MANPSLGYNVESMFFDRRLVTRRIGARKARYFKSAGANTRRTMKSMLKLSGKGGRIAAPGEPPRKRVGSLYGNVLFAFDPSIDGVVVGVRGFKTRSPITVPGLLESGGRVPGFPERVKVYRKGKIQWRRTGDTVTAQYSKHPFAEPALLKEAPTFAGLFAATA